MGLSFDEAVTDLRQRSAAEPGIGAQTLLSLIDEDGPIIYAFPSLSYVPRSSAVPVSIPPISGDYLEGSIVAHTVLPPPGEIAQFDRNWDLRLDIMGGIVRGPINRLPIIGAQLYRGPLLWIRDRDTQAPTVSIQMTRDGRFLRGIGRLPGGAAGKSAFCTLAFTSVG